MAGVEITLDFGEVLNKLNRLDANTIPIADGALQVVAEEVLRLSQKEVPHDTGMLQNTGNVQSMGSLDKVVGYHTRYAARLHEHPEYRFQKGRKGKYLEDPIKNNRDILLKFFGNKVKEGIGRAL